MDATLERILALCKERGISQAELAEGIGIKGGTITAWKSGLSSSYKKLLKEIADFLGVSVAYLVGEEMPMPDNIVALPKTKKVPPTAPN